MASNLSGLNDRDEISLEDAAWVDSCLTGDDKMSEDRWNAITEALLVALQTQATLSDQSDTALNAQATLQGSAAATVNLQAPLQEAHSIAAALSSEASSSTDGSLTADSAEFMEEEDELDLGIEEAEIRRIRNNECFLYTDLEEENGDTGAESPPPIPPRDTESAENIFRIWDLESLDEENELMKQLGKAMAESSLLLEPLCQEENELNDLITGFIDLSLGHEGPPFLGLNA